MGKQIWTPEMTERLVELRAAGVEIPDIACEFGITKSAVSAKCGRMREAGMNIGRERSDVPQDWEDGARASTIALGCAVQAYRERRAA